MRIPYLLVVGDREMGENTVAVRSLGGNDLGAMQVDEYVRLVNEQSGF